MLDLQSGEDPRSLDAAKNVDAIEDVDALQDVDSMELCSDTGKNCIQLDQPEFWPTNCSHQQVI